MTLQIAHECLGAAIQISELPVTSFTITSNKFLKKQPLKLIQLILTLEYHTLVKSN